MYVNHGHVDDTLTAIHESSSTAGDSGDESGDAGEIYGNDNGNGNGGSGGGERKGSSRGGPSRKDALLAFLHLRTVRVRDLQEEVLQLCNYFRSVERTLTLDMAATPVEDSTVPTGVGVGDYDGEEGGFGSVRGDAPSEMQEFVRLVAGLGGGYNGVANHDDYYSTTEGHLRVVRADGGVAAGICVCSRW